MGFLDSLFDKMGLSDDEEYYDDDFYDDFEDDGPTSTYKKPNRQTVKTAAPTPEPAPVRNTNSTVKPATKVTPIGRTQKKSNVNLEVCVQKPSSVEDAREVTEALLDGTAVILNLEGLDIPVAQRIIDFSSGSCFALSGNLQKISNYIFIITPQNVDIFGDFQDILNGNINVNTLRDNY